mgnify:CR=1 FL=1
MPKFAESLRKVLEPSVLAPIAVSAALLLLSGVFNVLYTCLHDAQQCSAAHSRIGPVPSSSLQNTTEAILSFTGYAMVVFGLYDLYTSAKRVRRGSSYHLAIGLTLIIVGVLLLAVMFAAKRGA